MDIADIGELFFIVPIETVPSILVHGILSHDLAEKLPHRSIASSVIQDRRAKVVVPGGGRLHSYTNLYICQRNPMMIKILRDGHVRHDELAVLRVSPDVLSLPRAVVSDGNASSDYTRFGASPAALANLDRDRIHAEWWTRHLDQRMVWEHGRVKCSEVLVPGVVDPATLIGAYASCEASATALRAIMTHHDVTIAAYGFFR